MLAIVLSRRDFRENDQIISLYTKEQGKLELLARGVKKIVSKQSAHLEPFSLVHITVEPGKEIDHLIKTQPVEYFSGIRVNLAKSLAAGFVVSVTDKLTQVGERDAKIFDALFGWLRFVEHVQDVVSVVDVETVRGVQIEQIEQIEHLQHLELCTFVDGYIVVLLHCLGLTPVLEECVVCGKSFHEMARDELDGKAKSGFYFAGGGLICSGCRIKKEQAGEIFSAKGGYASGVDCGLKEVSDMALLLKGDWRLIENFALSGTEQKKLHRLVYEFAVYHSEKNISDWGKMLV